MGKGGTSSFFSLGFFAGHVEEAVCEGPKLGLHPCPPPRRRCLSSCHLLPALNSRLYAAKKCDSLYTNKTVEVANGIGVPNPML